jgi:PAS domain S-box-containing protein
LNNFTQGKLFYHTESRDQDFELLTRALDASISGIIISDNTQPDNPIIYCNAAFENMSGYSRKEIIGHNCRFLQQDDRIQKARAVLGSAIEQGIACKVCIRNYRKNGSLFWNELFLSPIKDQNGNVTHFIGVQNDVSGRKELEQKLLMQQKNMELQIAERTKSLRESELFLSSIISTVRESLLVLDPDFKVVSANSHFLKTFKVDLQQTTGKLLYELGNHQWDIPSLKELLTEILPSSNPVEDFEVEHDFPYIGKKLMLLNAYRVELEGQFKDQILLAIEDITDRREIERRKDDFLSIASHELKTPLTTIKGYVQALEKMVPEDSSEKFKLVLHKASIHVNKLNDLIAELLDVSRIQTGNIELHKEELDFDQTVFETVEGIQSATKTHQIQIHGKSGSKILADESHVIQVLNNLISNAIKYAPDSKEILVYISLVSEYVKVSVTDYGMGIKLEDQKRLFERFFRVGEIQQRFPGMGIGLYICDQIIKNHGGTLWVESERGKGSTFSFTLPINITQNNE